MRSEPKDRHRFLIGSTNPGKVREYREILGGLDLELVAPTDLNPVPPEPDEDALTFAENASTKARGYAAASRLQTIADDSGLEVYALHGAPGVRSRRFFGDDASAEERNAKLLALLDGAQDRSAAGLGVRSTPAGAGSARTAGRSRCRCGRR